MRAYAILNVFTSRDKFLLLRVLVKVFKHAYSLESRRLCTDLFWCYKIVLGLVSVDLGDTFK